ncbi:MAG TPA: hypothetical protein VM013_06285 [Dehalococcoidia bacterium]|nr:hypothetical protein [Dehalococcoidia bacterium]
MTKPSTRRHGLYAVPAGKTEKACSSCGGKQGWHSHVECKGLNSGWGSCIVSHVDERHGTRRCRLQHGWDVVHRLTRRGACHFHQYTGDGLYCEHHARELAAAMNVPMHEVA